MPLNRVEQIAALSLLGQNNWRELGWLVETTRNLTAKQKVIGLKWLVGLALDRNDDEARKEMVALLTDADAAFLAVVRREALRPVTDPESAVEAAS